MAKNKLFNSKKFLHEAGRMAASRVRFRASAKIKSTQLKQAMALMNKKSSRKLSQWSVYVPHYWAVYYHDGRRAIRTRGKKRMIFYKDPKQDPRHNGRYPQRLKQKRSLSLTKQEFARDRDKMIITNNVKATVGEKFFDNNVGMAGILTPIGRDILGLMSDHTKNFLGKDLNIKSGLTIGF